MHIGIVASGSDGNSMIIKSPKSCIIVDIGISARLLAERLAEIGIKPEEVDAVLITHEHIDHFRGVPTFCRRFSKQMYINEQTFFCVKDIVNHIKIAHFYSGKNFRVGEIEICPFPIPHNAADPVGFIVSVKNSIKVGIATDLGYPTELVKERLKGCQVLIIESNHDPDMLRESDYPWSVKQRIGSRHGHLANHQTANMVESLIHDDLQCIVLSHISKNTNIPALATQTVKKVLQTYGKNDVQVIAAHRGNQPILLGY
jgi:phosphoribosyl 1,2-cyclic phosphodiesterase